MTRIFAILAPTILLIAMSSDIRYLADNVDVTVSAPQAGQVLIYKGAGWANDEFDLQVSGNLNYQGGNIDAGLSVGSISATTDANGDVQVYHGLLTSYISCAVTVTDTTLYHSVVHGKTDTYFTVRFFEPDTSGLPQKLASSTVSFDFSAKEIFAEGFIDRFPGAELAISTRLLRSVYTGPLVTLRRDSDDATKSFYPDSRHELSLTSEDGSGTTLASWVTTNSAHLVTWHDQSGNGNDATQSNTDKQPLVVSSGSLVTEGSRAAVDFDGNATGALMDNLFFPAVASSAITIVTVVNSTAAGSNIHMGGDGANNYFTYKSNGTTHRVRIDGGTVNFSSPGTTGHQLLTFFKNTTDAQLFQSGSSLGTSSSFGSDVAEFDILGAWQDESSNSHDGTIQEVIIYKSDQASNRVQMEAEINNHYQIY